MNRRQFIQSLAAACALPAAPALPLKPAMAALPAAAPATLAAASAAAMATKARFWTIYMYGLHGNCTPATLSAMLNIPEAQARGYLTKLIADGVIRPNALLRNSVARALKSDDDSLVGKVKDRLEMKADAEDPEEEMAVVEGEDLPDEAMADEADEVETDEAEDEENLESTQEAVEGDTDMAEGELEVASQAPDEANDVPRDVLNTADYSAKRSVETGGCGLIALQNSESERPRIAGKIVKFGS